jgi:hypothetical protein
MFSFAPYILTTDRNNLHVVQVIKALYLLKAQPHRRTSKEALIEIILALDRENKELLEKGKAEQQKRSKKFVKPNTAKKRRKKVVWEACYQSCATMRTSINRWRFAPYSVPQKNTSHATSARTLYGLS